MSAEGARLLVQGVVVAASARPHSDAMGRGEIVGLAGLDGHGQEAFLAVLAGLRRAIAGHVSVATGSGDPVRVVNFRQAARHGIAYLPRDRRGSGIFPTLSVLDNFAIASLERDSWAGFIRSGRRRKRYELWRDKLAIVAPGPEAAIASLSGGNQQKVLLARWLAREPRVLLLDDPTRGVDQRTRETLYAAFRDLARDGLTLVILSSEIEEIVRLCSRVLVFREQSLSAQLAGASLTHAAVIAAMFGRPA